MAAVIPDPVTSSTSPPSRSETEWRPSARQELFLTANEDEVLFGGAAGGGKSDGLILDALGLGLPVRSIDKRDYRALLIRQTFPQLRELIDRSRVIYPRIVPGVVYHEQSREWRWPSGAKIIYGYCERDEDVYQYQGQQFQWIGIDELGHFGTPRVLDYLTSRLRSPDKAMPCYVRATCNPGPKWIMTRWGIGRAGQASSNDVSIDGVTCKRRFIPSRLSDNPHLVGTGYEERLKRLPDADRRALLEGEWGIVDVPGAFFSEQMRHARLSGRIGRFPYDSRLLVDTFWDLGRFDATAIWFMQRVGSEYRAIDYYEQAGKALPYHASQLKGRGYNYGEHWAPFDIEVAEFGTGQTRLEIARGLGINFRIVARQSFQDGIGAVRVTLPMVYFDSERCERGIEVLEKYRQDFNSRLGEFTGQAVHDEYSHGADAFRYFSLTAGVSEIGAKKILKYRNFGVV